MAAKTPDFIGQFVDRHLSGYIADHTIVELPSDAYQLLSECIMTATFLSDAQVEGRLYMWRSMTRQSLEAGVSPLVTDQAERRLSARLDMRSRLAVASFENEFPTRCLEYTQTADYRSRYPFNAARFLAYQVTSCCVTELEDLTVIGEGHI